MHVHHLVDFLSDGPNLLPLARDQASYGQLSGIIDNVNGMAHHKKIFKTS